MPPKKKLPPYLSRRTPATSAESSNSGAISKLPMKRKVNENTTEIATSNRKINPSGRIFLSEKVVGSTFNENEDDDEDEEENRDESLDFSKSRIEEVSTSNHGPKSRTTNIDLTGDFTSPITSDSSSTFMSYSSKGSDHSISIVGKPCPLAHLKIGEESEAVVCALPGFQGHFEGMRCRSYKIFVSDARLEVVLDKHINLIIRVFLTELAQKPSAYGLNNEVKCSFILLNKLTLVYYY